MLNGPPLLRALVHPRALAGVRRGRVRRVNARRFRTSVPPARVYSAVSIPPEKRRVAPRPLTKELSGKQPVGPMPVQQVPMWLVTQQPVPASPLAAWPVPVQREPP
jgi:hypothetical protein